MSDHDKPDRLGFQAMFGQERGSDVEFEVGPDGGTWRFTAHKRVLATSSPVMKVLFEGPITMQSTKRFFPIRVEDVEPRAFKCLLRYLYGLSPELQKVPTALSVLYAAHKYMCAGLEWECCAFLNDQVQLKPDYVLDILQTVSFFCQRNDSCEPTAPPAEEVESDSEGSRLVGGGPRRGSRVSSCHSSPRKTSIPEPPLGEASVRLRHNCLQVIDQNADTVLPLEQVEDLDQNTLLAMMSRDTLAVSSELVVFQAAERWAECECKRRKLPHASHHLRQALGGPHIVCSGQLARLLLLSPQQFAEGPARSPLLSSEEQKCLLVHLVGCSGAANDSIKQPPSSPQHMNWHMMGTSRVPASPQYLPIPSALGSRVAPCDAACKSSSKSRHWGLRWPRSKRKEKQVKIVESKKEKEQPERPGCCTRSCEIFISVIACLFD